MVIPCINDCAFISQWTVDLGVNKDPKKSTQHHHEMHDSGGISGPNKSWHHKAQRSTVILKYGKLRAKLG